MNILTPPKEEENLRNKISLLQNMRKRPRRNRKSRSIRELVQETRLHPSDLIYPLFIKEGRTEPIKSLPHQNRLSLNDLYSKVEQTLELGVGAIALFPVVECKDQAGSEALNPNNLCHRAVYEVKKRFSEVCVITDVALDPYTTHGHDGVVNNQEVLNDETVDILAKMAVLQAQAGADMVAPSDMMDGRVGAIRDALDASGYQHVNIHAYSAKYASAFYGPFRDAVGSKLQFGDKKSYQMHPANVKEALVEAALDEAEGADILMVKPAGAYLDVIAKLRAATNLPISAYQVSGEYAMIQAAAEKGWLDAENALLESLVAIKRAGADMIFTYAALTIAALH